MENFPKIFLYLQVYPTKFVFYVLRTSNLPVQPHADIYFVGYVFMRVWVIKNPVPFAEKMSLLIELYFYRIILERTQGLYSDFILISGYSRVRFY